MKKLLLTIILSTFATLSFAKDPDMMTNSAKGLSNVMTMKIKDIEASVGGFENIDAPFYRIKYSPWFRKEFKKYLRPLTIEQFTYLVQVDMIYPDFNELYNPDTHVVHELENTIIQDLTTMCILKACKGEK